MLDFEKSLQNAIHKNFEGVKLVVAISTMLKFYGKKLNVLVYVQRLI